MLHIKKYLTEGLIQFTILLSLIGVRVDVDTYFNGYLSPILETNIGPTSAYIQTHFHNLRDTLDGYSLHPKCPDLDSYFASRRLLHEVRALGSPRFPTRLSAWLVHLVPTGADSAAAGPDGGGAGLSEDVSDGESGGQTVGEGDGDCTVYRRRGQEDGAPSVDPESCPRPCPSAACKEDAEALGTLLWKREQNNPSAAEGRATDAPALSLDHSPIFDTEGLHGDGVAFQGEPFPGSDADRQWHDFLSMSGLDDLDVNISSPISQDVSLQDAMVTGGVVGGEARRESSGSDGLVGGAGFLDEAVFEQINLLGLEGGVATLEGRDSDSGLSLGSGSYSPASSEESLGQSGFEAAAGWSGDAMATGQWVETPLEWAELVRHDHTYMATPLQCDRRVKEEELSEEEEDEDEDEEDLSRDEQRARALRLPVCVRDVVHMPVEDFLRLLGGRGLSERQVTLLRDIRRRGKNKLAARKCRRRKLEAIGRLEGEVGQLERQRAGLLRERAQNARVRAGLMQRLEHLTERILVQLQLSPAHHRLHFCDGQVSVLPRGHAHRRERRRKDKKP